MKSTAEDRWRLHQMKRKYFIRFVVPTQKCAACTSFNTVLTTNFTVIAVKLKVCDDRCPAYYQVNVF